MLACLKGHQQAVKFLIKLTKNINRKDKLGNSALHYAMILEDKIVIKMLLTNS